MATGVAPVDLEAVQESLADYIGRTVRVPSAKGFRSCPRSTSEFRLSEVTAGGGSNPVCISLSAVDAAHFQNVEENILTNGRNELTAIACAATA